MPTQRSKWDEVILALEVTRRYTRSFEERANQRFRYAVLLSLLAVAAAGFIFLLIHRLY